MNYSDNVQIVRQLYIAYGQGDVESMLTLLTENVEWHFVGHSQDIPYAGHYQGQEAVATLFALLTDTCELHLFGPLQIMASGSHVVVLGHERVRVRPTDRFFETEWAHWFTLKDGKIERWQEFHDTATIAAAFRPVIS
ncbi:MAG: nuclear transport factor 2 family protein [Chloroflexi bacterium]|nr:nuclear transport factor 2 family protein [Chloroflexota bacterium]MBP8057762.1 nuclear transport factor 2 family protein [Chloroflexota bacterium]